MDVFTIASGRTNCVSDGKVYFANVFYERCDGNCLTQGGFEWGNSYNDCLNHCNQGGYTEQGKWRCTNYLYNSFPLCQCCKKWKCN